MADEDSWVANTSQIKSKPGWQTTEFYITVFTACLPLSAIIFHRDFSNQVQPWSAAAAGIASAAYVIARSLTKRSVMNARVNVHTAQLSNTAASMPTSAPAAPPTTSMAAVPIDTLALMLAKLDQLTEAEHHKTNWRKKAAS